MKLHTFIWVDMYYYLSGKKVAMIYTILHGFLTSKVRISIGRWDVKSKTYERLSMMAVLSGKITPKFPRETKRFYIKPKLTKWPILLRWESYAKNFYKILCKIYKCLYGAFCRVGSRRSSNQRPTQRSLPSAKIQCALFTAINNNYDNTKISND